MKYNLVYKTLTKDSDKKEIFALCRNKEIKKLYGSARQLYYVYKLPNVIRVMTVAYCQEFPVGIGFLLSRKTHINTLQLYVKPEFRRIGIGTQIVENLIPFFENKETYYESDENQLFFKKLEKKL